MRGPQDRISPPRNTRANVGDKKRHSPERSIEVIGGCKRGRVSPPPERRPHGHHVDIPSTAIIPTLWVAVMASAEKTDQLPFCQDIAEETPPANFKVPKFNIYDAKSNSPTHVQQFRSRAALCGLNEAMMCRTFLLSLPDAAMLWYTQLKPGSISSFNELERSFTSCFSGSNRRPKTVEALMDLRRKVSESLKDFSDRCL